MKNVESSANQFKDLLQSARQVLLLTRTQASTDGVAATLALGRVIRSFGRGVLLATPEKLSDSFNGLPGIQEFKTSVGPKSLVVSIDHEPGSIAKVSYGEEGNKFNLVVTPVAGRQVRAENVNFSFSGGDYDLVVALDTPDLALLGSLYESEAATWEHMPLVNIDRHPANTQFGRVNVLDHEAASTSEVVGRLVVAAKLPLPKDAAELLLLGIREATGNFQNSGPGSFEVAASLARVTRGGRTESTEERLVNEPFRKSEVRTVKT